MKFDFKVVDKACKEFALVQDFFNSNISKLYGSQVSALDKIGHGNDRICEMLFKDDRPKGIIVYKRDLQEGALELKTLSLLNPDRNSGKGYGSMLLDRIIDTAIRRQADHILVTALVSSAENSSLNFFKHKGFRIIQECPDKYVKGHSEAVLTFDIKKPELDKKNQFDNFSQNVTFMTDKQKHSTKEEDDKKIQFQHDNFSPDIKCTLKKQYVNAIRDGKKTYEGRVNTNFFKPYLPGKTVEWYCGSKPEDKVTTKIVSRNVYSSFSEMLAKNDYKKFVPEARNLEHAKSLYDSIPGYSEKVEKHGALALGLTLFEHHKLRDKKLKKDEYVNPDEELGDKAVKKQKFF